MRSLAILTAVLMLATFQWGCSDDDGPTQPATTANQEATAGDEALAQGDYAAANTHYRAALQRDPTHAHASLGAAITEVYLVQNDPEVAALVDELEPLVPAPQNLRIASGLLSRPRGSGLLGGPSAFRWTPMAGGRAFARVVARAVQDPPAVSDIQRVLRLKVMPRLRYAQQRLAVVEMDTDFALRLPPAITDEPDTIEVDLGEVFVLDAVVRGVAGWVGMLVAYDFDVPSYEAVNPESLLTDGTDFGTLHPTGASDLADARNDLLAMNDRLDDAVAFVLAETDEQTDDIIVEETFDTQDFIELADGVDVLANSLNGPVSVEIETYDQQLLMVDVSAGRFFVPAITDLKTILPAHDFDTAGDPYVLDPIDFPDPTINGIFPGMTNAVWQQILGPQPPPPIARP